MAAAGCRLTLRGTLTAPDDFGRLRLFVLRRRPGGASDGSWQALHDEAARHGGLPLPFKRVQDAGDPELLGLVTLTLPARRREHWLRVAGGLRGQWVAAEVVPRRYRNPKTARPGVALDLVALDVPP